MTAWRNAYPAWTRGRKQVSTVLICLMIIVVILVGAVHGKYVRDAAHNHRDIQSITGSKPPSSGTWNVTNLTIVENERLLVNGSIHILPGGALIIRNSTICLNMAKDLEYEIRVSGGGNLTISDSVITSCRGFRYTIIAEEGSDVYIKRSAIYYLGLNAKHPGLIINTDDAMVINNTIRHGYISVLINGSTGCVVEFNDMRCEYGVVVLNSSECTIYGNTIRSNYGIVLNFSSLNNVSENVMLGGGIFVWGRVDDFNNTINHNVLNGGEIKYLYKTTGEAIIGASQAIVAFSSNVTVSRVVTDNVSIGLEIVSSKNVVVEKANISSARTSGLLISGSSNVTIREAHLSGCNIGILANNCTQMTVYYSNIATCGVGIRLVNVSGAKVFLNNFIANRLEAYDDGSNMFDNGKYGNYWSEFRASDDDKNGILDRPYKIDDNSLDRYPLANPVASPSDWDGDGLSNVDEDAIGSSPVDWDTDDDGMPDGWEVRYGLNPLSGNDADYDNDMDDLTNVDEYRHGTNPTRSDTDDDGMPDGWEVRYGLNPLVNDSMEDADMDGLTNIEEYQMSTNPANPDTDGDGWSDGDEVRYGADPRDPNSYPTSIEFTTPTAPNISYVTPSGGMNVYLIITYATIIVVPLGVFIILIRRRRI